MEMRPEGFSDFPDQRKRPHSPVCIDLESDDEDEVLYIKTVLHPIAPCYQLRPDYDEDDEVMYMETVCHPGAGTIPNCQSPLNSLDSDIDKEIIYVETVHRRPIAVVPPRHRSPSLTTEDDLFTTNDDVAAEAELGQEMGLDCDIALSEHVNEDLIESVIVADSNENYNELIERSNEEHGVIELEINCSVDFSDEDHDYSSDDISPVRQEDNLCTTPEASEWSDASRSLDVYVEPNRDQSDHQIIQTRSPQAVDINHNPDMSDGQNQEQRCNPQEGMLKLQQNGQPKSKEGYQVAMERTKDTYKRYNKLGHGATQDSPERNTWGDNNSVLSTPSPVGLDLQTSSNQDQINPN